MRVRFPGRSGLPSRMDKSIRGKTGTTLIIPEQFDGISIGERAVSRELVQYLRSRNIQINAKNVKPFAQLYCFLDGIDVTNYCIPKLLEIDMISGIFSVGETVIGTVNRNIVDLQSSRQNNPKITFRVSSSNHKEGPYNNPTSIYPLNPYTKQTLQSTYSSTSTILNIDTYSLSSQYQGEFSGWIQSEMILVGQTSGAQATIKNVRLISDSHASFIGSLFIPDPSLSSNPKFRSGQKIITLIDNSINNKSAANTISEEKFISSGIIETNKESIISTRSSRISQKQTILASTTTTNKGSIVLSNSISPVSSNTSNLSGCQWNDPLARSFLVEDQSGIFITKLDLFFKTKDRNNIPIIVQIRTMQNNYPTQVIVPFSEVILGPEKVKVSNDGSVATTFEFESPVYLEGGKEYSIVVGSNSSNYNVFTSRVGETDLSTQLLISNQPYAGTLFKPQNASVWESSQLEDLKFTLYRAQFLSSGSAEFYSPELSTGNSQIPTLQPNPLILNSRVIRIGLSTNLVDSGLTLGNTVLQQGTNASGNYVDNAGIATGTLRIINAGIGYTPSSGSLTFADVILESITGNGRNAKANITIANGVAVAATISASGNGYRVGDILGITTIGANSLGRNASFSLVSIASTNEIILDNVQGDFSIAGAGKTVQYINNSGITTTLNSSLGGNVQISDINIESDGLHVAINHQNHGMYFNDNIVKIADVQPDVPPSRLTSNYNFDSTGSILIDDSSQFTTFENVSVAPTNPGYALIGRELFKYESVTAGSLNTITRLGFISPTSFDAILACKISYPSGTSVYKYELGGVSLRRINTIHNLSNVTISNAITFDSYNIKLQMNENGLDRSVDSSFPKLYLNETKLAGGFNVKATQNIPFEIITPMVQNTTVQGTTINAEIRTITSSSISSNEVPFIDVGFESITLNKSNYLKTPRMIASKVNEDDKLQNIKNKKSMNMRLFLNTIDPKVSPVIDTQRINTILTSNRVNKVIGNYATDNRANVVEDDPSAFKYISKEVALENPASSIKILLDAHINNYCDIRAFYSIGENQGFDPIFTPFPGYKNLDSKKQIINFEDSDGLSDIFVEPSIFLGFESKDITYREYSFTADLLPSFKFYRIKLVLTSTNQVYPPRIKNLRVIALA